MYVENVLDLIASVAVPPKPDFASCCEKCGRVKFVYAENMLGLIIVFRKRTQVKEIISIGRGIGV